MAGVLLIQKNMYSKTPAFYYFLAAASSQYKQIIPKGIS